MPHLDNRSMITYKSSDIKLGWSSKDGSKQMCGYVKEGKGKIKVTSQCYVFTKLHLFMYIVSANATLPHPN